MSEKSFQGKCSECNSEFPVDSIEEDIRCPKCGFPFANITVSCPHCGQEFDTDGSLISSIDPCPTCGEKFVWNTVKATDGSWMVVSRTGRLELHDMASLVSIMQQKMGEKETRAVSNDVTSNSKGCLGSFILVLSFGTSLILLL